MDRQRSMSPETNSQVASNHLPPWEVKPVTRVPYCKTSSPPNEEGGYSAPSSYNDPRMVKSARYAPKFGHAQTADPRMVKSARHAPDFGPPPSAERKTSAWSAPLPASSMPYDTQLYAQHPGYMGSNIPPPLTPPDSASHSSGSMTASPPEPVVAMPGTMSARTTEGKTKPSHGRAQSEGRHVRTNTSKKRDQSAPVSFGTRLRNFFRRDPVDESQFERIHDRHWTEEDY